MWLKDEAAGAGIAAAFAAVSHESDERDVAAHLYSVRLTRAIMALLAVELNAAGSTLHPHAADRLEMAVGSEVETQLARMLRAVKSAAPVADFEAESESKAACRDGARARPRTAATSSTRT